MKNNAYPNWLRRLEEVFLFRSVLARMRKQRYLGHRIFYDFQSCLAQFDPEEKVLLERKGLDAIEVVMQRLSRGNEVGFQKGDMRRIEACKMFSKVNQENATCRHKARVMEAFLNDLGIPAKRVSFHGVGHDGGWIPHAVVYIFEMEKYADPTNSLPGNYLFMTKDELISRWSLNSS